MNKEFFPLENWGEIEKVLLDDHDFLNCLSDAKLNDVEIGNLAKELNKVLLKISGDIQSNSKWISVRETVSYQHKVDISLLPNGMSKTVDLEIEMSKGIVGIEEKLIGKSTQSVPIQVSFNVKKLPPKHPLFFTSGKHFSGKVTVKNVYNPPFKIPKLTGSEGAKGLTQELLILFRHIPFDLALKFSTQLGTQDLASGAGKKIKTASVEFLNQYSKIPDKFKHTTLRQIGEIGPRFDPEMELAFMESLYRVFRSYTGEYEPSIYIGLIQDIFEQRFEKTLDSVYKQMQQQQEEIHKDFSLFGEIENEKQRLIALHEEYERQKSKGASEEVLRKARQGMEKVASHINQRKQKYETSKGIILIQELYLSTLEKTETFEKAMTKVTPRLGELKKIIQSNHISVSKDLEILSKGLGVHAKHLLIQHAIYSEVEPDLDKVVLLDDVNEYDSETVSGVLDLIPTLKRKFDGKKIGSNRLLKETLETDLPEHEKKAFDQYIEENPDPKNNQVQRLTQQLDQFLTMKKFGSSLDSVSKFLNEEINTLKAVVTFSAAQNKLNTDLKNHIRYYEKLFMQPYFDLLEESNYEEFDDLDRRYDRLRNSLKSQMEIKYTVAEEKALLSMFRQINAQLHNENLFSANVFSKQIRNFMNLLKKHKSFISGVLMKKILETYTVFIMGSSRTKNLPSESGRLKAVDISKIKESRDHLTK